MLDNACFVKRSMTRKVTAFTVYERLLLLFYRIPNVCHHHPTHCASLYPTRIHKSLVLFRRNKTTPHDSHCSQKSNMNCASLPFLEDIAVPCIRQFPTTNRGLHVLRSIAISSSMILMKHLQMQYPRGVGSLLSVSFLVAAGLLLI